MAVSSLIVRWLVALSVLTIAVILSACIDSPPPTPEPTAAATATPGPETPATAPPEPAPPTLEPTAAATATLSPEPTATAIPEPTRPTPEPAAAATATPSPGPTATATPEPARPTSVTVSPAKVDLTVLGATAQLRTEVRDQDSTVMTGVTVTWTTSANSVATVDALGVVTAAGNGTATITASAGSASGSAVVTVTQEVASVAVSPSVTELTAWGETVQLAAEALDANGHAVVGAEFSWESANSVATVDALGVVTAAGNGTATITASAGSASGPAVVTVTQEVASVEVSPSMVELTAWGETVQLAAEALDANGHAVVGAEFSWESADAQVAEVDVLGVVTASDNGRATITVSAGSASGSAVVTVTQEAASVEVSPSMAGLTAWGETVQLAAEALDANGHAVVGAEFSWESADAQVAEVDVLGVVTASDNGRATITVSAGSASGSAVVTVTQEAASVEVSPSMAGLTAWGETVQLAAEALDANGHAVVGAVLSWESADALVAEVDALGLVSGIGEGEATITASAGAASGSALVAVPPTYTLSGTVRDSRENGPMLAGAVVRIENGKRGEAKVIGPDGRYRFPNVWGTVTVRIIAWPTHGAETVEIAMDEDRTLDFNLEHTGTPPFAVTYISPQIIERSDPTRLGSITYAGRGERRVWDKWSEMWNMINAYLFDAQYEGQVVEFLVNPEFGSREAAQAEVETFAHALGQMPAVLMPGVKRVIMNAGWARWYASRTEGRITIHTDFEPGNRQEGLVHEATHTTLDLAHIDSPGWRAAQEADGVFISNYAWDNPDREDVAESFLAWFAVRYQSERLSAAERVMILRTIPNRLIYFDEQGFDMSPYTPSEVQYPSEEIVTMQGKVIGPNNQPVEGTFLRAWPDGADAFVDKVGTATTGEDGSFAIVVPDGSFAIDGSFILDVFAPGLSSESKEGCTFVGWHGPGGFTTVREDATRFKVDGESVLDIVIRLPDHPDALPRIEWCA